MTTTDDLQIQSSRFPTLLSWQHQKDYNIVLFVDIRSSIVTVSESFARLVPLGLPRRNCDQRVFQRNCCNSGESIRPGSKHVIIFVIFRKFCQNKNRWMQSFDDKLRDPPAMLFISRDTCSDGIAKLFHACFVGYRTIIAQYVAKWGIAQMCLCETKCQGGGIVIAATASQHRAMWGH